MASNEQEMPELLNRAENVSLESRLRLSRSKCYLVLVDRAAILPQQLIQDIERKDEVEFLGARVTNRGIRTRNKPEESI